MTTEELILERAKAKAAEQGIVTDAEKLAQEAAAKAESDQKVEAERLAAIEAQASEAAKKDAETKAAEEAAKLEAERIAAEKLQKKSLFEKAQEKTETKTEDAPDLTAENASLKEKLNQAESILKKVQENPFVQALDYKGDLNDLIQVARELIPEDYSKFGYEQLVRMDLEKSLQLTGEELEEAVLDKMAETEAMKPYQKKAAENELRTKFTPTKSESARLKTIQEEISKRLSPAEIARQEAEAIKKIQEEDLAAIDATINEYDGSEEFGLQFTKEYGNKFKSEYDQLFLNSKRFLTPEGKPDVKKAAFAAFVIDNIDAIRTNYENVQKTKYDEGVAAGKKEFIEKYGNPEKTIGGALPLPEVKEKRTRINNGILERNN